MKRRLILIVGILLASVASSLYIPPSEASASFYGCSSNKRGNSAYGRCDKYDQLGDRVKQYNVTATCEVLGVRYRVVGPSIAGGGGYSTARCAVGKAISSSIGWNIY